VAKEYCWAITQVAAGRSRCRRSSVLEFGFQLGSLLRVCVCVYVCVCVCVCARVYRVYIYIPGADKSLALPGRKQARKHVRDSRDFNHIETRAVKFFFFARQGAEGN